VDQSAWRLPRRGAAAAGRARCTGPTAAHGAALRARWRAGWRHVPYLVDESTGQATPTAEGTAKPEIVLNLPLKNAPLEMIPCFATVSEQVLEDIAGVRAWIDAYLSNKVLAPLDKQLMAGTGVSPQLIGLAPLAGKTPDHPKGASESVADAILPQILAVETASGGLPCTGVVLAPDVYLTISTAKASTAGVYLSGTPITDQPPTLLWGRSMSVNPALAAGTAMVGSFLYGAVLRLKGGMRIAMTNSDSDLFRRNLAAVRAEIRCALTPNVPVAFGLVTGLVAG
jgi:HK97 family phage major capsid protein